MTEESRTSPKKVFYSYSSVDRVRVNTFADFAKSDGEEEQFLDHRTITPGAKWEPELFRGLDESGKIKVFWSRHSARSSWVRKEYEYFVSEYPDRTLVPILLDETPLDDLLGQYHAIQAKVPQAEAKAEGTSPLEASQSLLDLLKELKSLAEPGVDTQLTDMLGAYRGISARLAELRAGLGLEIDRRSASDGGQPGDLGSSILDLFKKLRELGELTGAEIPLAELRAEYEAVSAKLAVLQADAELEIEQPAEGGERRADSARSILERYRGLRKLGLSKKEIRRDLVRHARRICADEGIRVEPHELYYAVSPCWLSSPFDPRSWWARTKSATNWVREAISHLTRPQVGLGVAAAFLAALIVWLLWPRFDGRPEPGAGRIAGVLLNFGGEISTFTAGSPEPSEGESEDGQWLEVLREQTRLIREWSEKSSEESRLLREALEKLDLSLRLDWDAESLPTRDQMDRLIAALGDLDGGDSVRVLIPVLESLRTCVCSDVPPEASCSPSISSLEVLDFDGLQAGEIVGPGPLEVRSRRLAGRDPAGDFRVRVEGVPRLGGRNAAMIFDSGDPKLDPDLGTPNETCSETPERAGRGAGGEDLPGNAFRNCQRLRNLLIVAANLTDRNGDGLADGPDDTDNAGAQLTLDFSELPGREATLHRVDFVDIDSREGVPEIWLLGPEGERLVDPIRIPSTGDNGFVRVSLGPTPGVRTMEVRLRGSGAVDNVVFEPACP